MGPFYLIVCVCGAVTEPVTVGCFASYARHIIGGQQQQPATLSTACVCLQLNAMSQNDRSGKLHHGSSYLVKALCACVALFLTQSVPAPARLPSPAGHVQERQQRQAVPRLAIHQQAGVHQQQRGACSRQGRRVTHCGLHTHRWVGGAGVPTHGFQTAERDAKERCSCAMEG
jgi:hypothetical protein